MARKIEDWGNAASWGSMPDHLSNPVFTTITYKSFRAGIM
jgi:hypothetical protein